MQYNNQHNVISNRKLNPENRLIIRNYNHQITLQQPITSFRRNNNNITMRQQFAFKKHGIIATQTNMAAVCISSGRTTYWMLSY